MKLEPVLTEKSLNLAKDGKYTFWVGPSFSKDQIKKQVGEVFGVKVKRVRTANVAGGKKRTAMGRIRKIMPRKKAIVELEGKDTIDLFETKSK